MHWSISKIRLATGLNLHYISQSLCVTLLSRMHPHNFLGTSKGNRTPKFLSERQIFMQFSLHRLCYNHAQRVQVQGIQSLHVYVLIVQFSSALLPFKAGTFAELALFYIRSFLLCTHYLSVSTSEILCQRMTIRAKYLQILYPIISWVPIYVM